MSDIESMKAHRKEMVETVELRDMLTRLMKNRDFRKLILDEYLVNEAARLVQSSANINLGADQRADCLAMAQATGHFKAWMNVTLKRGDQAEVDIRAADEALDELRNEEASV
jgi:hypothetical protein